MTSADEFYSAMGQLSREMLELSNKDSNRLIKASFNWKQFEHRSQNQSLNDLLLTTILVALLTYCSMVAGSGRDVSLPLHRGLRAAREVHVQHYSVVTRHRCGQEGTQDPVQVR